MAHKSFYPNCLRTDHSAPNQSPARDQLVVRLRGGLGNQMFQYAAAMGVAHRNRLTLFVDPFTGFTNDSYERSFRLKSFNISAKACLPSECVDLIRASRMKRWIQLYRESLRQTFLHTNFDAKVSNTRVRGKVVMEGYWHSEQYFHDISSMIREEFTITKPLSPAATSAAEIISSASESVSVHLRRRIEYSSTGKRVGKASFICNDRYYHDAINHIQSIVGPVHAFVFTDGPVPADTVYLPCAYDVVSRPDVSIDYEDLCLMAKCRHHVIANSSFSWWGAWMGLSNGIVCAPNNFHPHKNRLPHDVYPKGWTVIPADGTV